VSIFSDQKAAKFMRQALTYAHEFSKDSSTKVSAMVIGRETHEVRSTGYNGMPRGCDDNNPLRHARPEKYYWYEHAERNAIYNAARVGTRCSESLLLVTMYPCMDCARAIVQSGIEEVVTLKPAADFLDRWGSHVEKSNELFSECGILVRCLDPREVLLGAPDDLKAYYAKILSI
jgi:dCMP deaminase